MDEDDSTKTTDLDALTSVVYAAKQVELVKDPKAKRLLLRAIEAIVESLEPGLEFEPELHLIQGGKA